MSDRVDPIREAQRVTGSAEVEAYEIDEGVVLHDARNPLAWIESSRSVAIDDAS